MSTNRLPRFATWGIVAFFLAIITLPLLRGETPVRWGLDLAGGVRVTYRPDPASVAARHADLDQETLLRLAKETLASRLARSLAAVPDVVVRSDGRIVVAVPGEDDQQKVLELVGKTYRLTLRLVEGWRDAPDPARSLPRYAGRYLDLAAAQFSGEMFDERHLRVLPPQPGATDHGALSAQVAFRFRPPHDRAFADFTGANVGRELAILLDDEVEWVGRIESAISGEGTLAGGYNVEEAARITDMLRAGTLPVGLVVEDLEAVGPSLGQEIRERGWQALAFAFLALVALLAIAYRHRRWLLVAGFQSLACLLLTTAGLIVLFGLTVDLAAVAGLILSVGMGLDAFILVFEAIETGDGNAGGGRRQRQSVVRLIYSFAGEGGTLLHANATTLAVVALLVSSERLGSFAIFIAVGILASLLTVLVTRWLLLRMGDLEPRPGRDLLAFLRHARPRLLRFRWLYAGVMVAAFAALAIGMTREGGPRLALGSDFEPGTQIVFESADAATAEGTIAALANRFPGVRLSHQRLGDADRGQHLATLGTSLALGPSDAASGLASAAEVTSLIRTSGSEPGSLHAIDARVAGRRMLQGLSALGLSFASLGLYLTVVQPAIDRAFGQPRAWHSLRARGLLFAGILLAVCLDVGLALGSLAALRMTIDLPVIAALLTVIGYSVNDSVVLAGHVARAARQHPDAAPIALVTTAADHILSRTVLTSVSTLLPAIGILVAGLEPLRAFAWVIVSGTVAGTLSSIFVVGSFAIWALRPAAATAIAATGGGQVRPA